MSYIDLKSTGRSEIKGRGVVYTTFSPVTCFRSTEAFIDAVGGRVIKIDGTPYAIRGVEMFMPGYPLAIGEPIGILIGTLV